MSMKTVACYSPGNPVRLLDELMYKLGEYDHLIMSMSRVRCMFETRNLRVMIVTKPEYLRGRKYDELFGFSKEINWIYRKNKSEKPFTGSLINYILREEGLNNIYDDFYY